MSKPDQPPPILPRIASGDPEAVKEAIQRYGSLIWSMASGYFGRSEETEDVVQEVYIELWKSAARFNATRGAESTFVATIARRRMIDAMRARGRRVEGEAQEITESPEAIQHGDLHAGFEQVDNQDELKRAAGALSGLPKEQRHVLELSLVRGLSHSQISKTVDLPLGTVKSHIRRSLEKVRLLLAGNPEPTEEVPS